MSMETSSPPRPPDPFVGSLVGRAALVRIAGVVLVILWLWGTICWAVDLP